MLDFQQGHFGAYDLLVSEHEQRQFALQTLDNGLRVLLVHTPDTRKSAVSACIQTGHFNDPDNIHGLAHLLEHMLFLGSEHYPIANGINDFLAAHGGGINAFTGTEFTNFHFDVHSDFLPDALLHFVDMLSRPLFNIELLDSEIQNIDAEFKAKQKDDLRRLYQVHKETCNPAHPFSKFSVGNELTFRAVELASLKETLINFHHTYYDTRNVSVCIISGLPINTLKAQTYSLLDDFFTSSQPVHTPLPPFYHEEHLGLQININPIKHARRLIVTFALPNLSHQYRSKPLNLISHFLGDEGQGSLLHFFKSKNWATSLTAGGGISGSNFKDFNLNLQLTEQGMDKVDAILSTVFSYLNMISETGIDSWRIKEKQILHKLAFDFDEPGKLIDEVVDFAQSMFEFPDEHIVAGEYLMDQACKEDILSMLAYFTPYNMRIKFVAPELETTEISQWYHTPYKQQPIPAAWLEQINNAAVEPLLSLPLKNQYVPQNTPIYEVNDNFTLPQKLLSKPNFEFWFAQDDHFNMPKGDCYLSFDCPVIEQGINIVAHKQLWVALTMESWRKRFYQAEVAGLHFHLYAHQGGFSLHTSGFSENQIDLTCSLLKDVQEKGEFDVSFTQVQERLYRAQKNTLLNKPLNRLFSGLSLVLKRNTYAPEAMAEAIKNTTLEDIYAVQQQLLDKFHLEGFMFGNWQATQALHLAKTIGDDIDDKEQTPKVSRDIVDLRNAAPYVYSILTQGQDEACVVYFQAPTDSIEDVALTILTEQLIAAPFFQQLRTQKQLGYLVGTGYSPFNQHPGMALYIQSPNVEASELVQHIHGFLQDAQHHFTQLSTYWENLCSSIANQLVEKDSTLAMKAQRLWMALGNEDFNFDRQHCLIDAIESLSFEQVEQYYANMLNQEGFGQLILLSTNQHNFTLPFEHTTIDDVTTFKASMPYMR